MTKVLTGDFLIQEWLSASFTRSSYAMDWMDTRLCYGEPSALNKYINLTQIWGFTSNVGRSTVKVTSDDGNKEIVEVAGIISLRSGSFATTKHIAFLNESDLHTLCIWLLTSTKKHSKKFNFGKLQELRDGKKGHESLKGYMDNTRLAILANQIDQNFRNYKKYEDIEYKKNKKKKYQNIQRGGDVDYKKNDSGDNKGSYGTVYDAYRMDIAVKVKHLAAPLESYEEHEQKKNGNRHDAAKSARYEAKALTILHSTREGGHPHINKIIDAVQNDAGFWIFVEACDQTAFDWAKQNVPLEGDGKLNIPAIESYIFGLLDAFRTIHQCQLVHLDQKFENLMFLKGAVQVIDFGIVQGPGISRHWTPPTWTGPGTSGWYAPEEKEYVDFGIKPNFKQIELIDSYKVGLLLLRMLSHNFLNHESWLKLVKEAGLLVWNHDRGCAEVKEGANIGLGPGLKESALGMRQAVEALGKKKSEIWPFCNALLPLIEANPGYRLTVTEVFNRLVDKSGKKLKSFKGLTEEDHRKLKARRETYREELNAFRNIRRRDKASLLCENIFSLTPDLGDLNKTGIEALLTNLKKLKSLNVVDRWNAVLEDIAMTLTKQTDSNVKDVLEQVKIIWKILDENDKKYIKENMSPENFSDVVKHLESE